MAVMTASQLSLLRNSGKLANTTPRISGAFLSEDEEGKEECLQ